MQIERIPTINRNIEILSLNHKAGTKASIVNALINKPNKGLKNRLWTFAPNLFQDSANHRSGWLPDSSCLLMFLNNITVPFLLGDALFYVSVAKNGLSLIVLFFEKIANS